MSSEISGSNGTSSFPVQTKLYSKIICGNHTDFVFSVYSDQLLLFVTQQGTSGTIITARQDASFDGSTTYSTSILLGRRDEPLLSLAARQVVQQAGNAGYAMPMTICLGLKEHSMETIRELVRTINENNTWTALAPDSP